MRRDDAVRLTETIRSAIVKAEHAADRATKLLAYAKQTEAWRAMGYSSFTEYVYTEFRVARNTAWKRLTQALVSGEIAEAAELSEPVVLTQRQAQQLRPKLRAVKDEVREATKAISPEERPAVVARIVRAHVGQTVERAVPPGYNVCPHCEGTGVVAEHSPVSVAQ